MVLLLIILYWRGCRSLATMGVASLVAAASSHLMDIVF